MDLKPQKSEEPWITKTWRPAMGWTYISICIFDFILAPIINYAFFYRTGASFMPWKPLTMSDGGLFHISMGAILGVVAYTRGQEKLKRYDTPNYDTPSRLNNESDYGQEDRADFRDRISRNSAREN